MLPSASTSEIAGRSRFSFWGEDGVSRQAMGEVAVQTAKAVIVDHPVTESVTGVDNVKGQIHIAIGEQLC